ncbi:hypothetical protein TRICI_000165 [Trichomonascus ciferrii]|uniref:F-box domain-containing protein n=1 Tax=Trichomonascus ciferrii TaxID=44093 RepID=A0A642VE57_9ASCO|nr:hypothetical protein TRICI_000165 [Trichomonascus ciferrii]
MGKFEQLPVELIENVCKNLDIAQLCSLRSTCKTFQAVVDDMKSLQCKIEFDAMHLDVGPDDDEFLCFYLITDGAIASDWNQFAIDQLEDPQSGLLFWAARLSEVLVTGNSTHTTEFVNLMDGLLCVFESEEIGGFGIRIEPYLRFGTQLEELVNRINASTAQFEMDVTFAEGYDDSEYNGDTILLGPKFQKVKFHLSGAFHPDGFFEFSNDCRKLKSVVASNLSVYDDERLDMFPWSLLEIPHLFALTDSIEIDELKLEGLELLVCSSLKDWGNIFMDRFVMTNVLLYGDTYDYSGSDTNDDDETENDAGSVSDGWEDSGDGVDYGDDNTPFEDIEDEDYQQSSPRKFALLDRGHKCMAKTVVIEQQLPDILRAFRFPRIKELEILNNVNTNYDHYVFQENPDFKSLERYVGPIDIEKPNLDAFKHLSNLETLTIIHLLAATRKPSTLIDPLRSACPKLDCIELINTTHLHSTVYRAPNWVEREPENLDKLPFRDPILDIYIQHEDLQMTVMEALEQEFFLYSPWSPSPGYFDYYDDDDFF